MRRLPLSTEPSRGTLDQCPHAGCGFKCCDERVTGPIVLYPGEMEEAAAAGRSLGHLEVLDAAYHGGVMTRCRATNAATCDDGYKPLACASYPLFPRLAPNDGEAPILIEVSKGEECPLDAGKIERHARFVRGAWRAVLARRPALASWLRGVWSDYAQHDDWERYHDV